MMTLYQFIVGSIIGSFLNVCIDRLPKEKSILYPRSHCETCNHPLGILELIPIISYILLKGRCKQCKTKLSKRMPFIELITGLAFVVLFQAYGLSLKTVLLELFVSVTIVLTIIDFSYMILPTGVIWCGLLGGLLIKSIQALMIGSYLELNLSLLGGAVGYSSFMLLEKLGRYLFKKECLGGGDIRLMGMIGFYVGIEYLCMMLVIASLFALVYGIGLMIKYKKSMLYPFGPFLNLGAYSVLFFGEAMTAYIIRYLI